MSGAVWVARAYADGWPTRCGDIVIDKETLGASDKALDYIVGITAKYILMSTGVSIAWFRRGNQDFPVLLIKYEAKPPDVPAIAARFIYHRP